MPIRNRHKVGDYLMVSDDTGFTHYRSEMVELWDGRWVHKRDYERRNPQDFVRAKDDPKALKNIRPAPAIGAVCLFTSPTVGETNIPTPKSIATNFAGIGDMEIGGTCGPFAIYDEAQL